MNIQLPVGPSGVSAYIYGRTAESILRPAADKASCDIRSSRNTVVARRRRQDEIGAGGNAVRKRTVPGAAAPLFYSEEKRRRRRRRKRSSSPYYKLRFLSPYLLRRTLAHKKRVHAHGCTTWGVERVFND